MKNYNMPNKRSIMIKILCRFFILNFIISLPTQASSFDNQMQKYLLDTLDFGHSFEIFENFKRWQQKRSLRNYFDKKEIFIDRASSKDPKSSLAKILEKDNYFQSS